MNDAALEFLRDGLDQFQAGWHPLMATITIRTRKSREEVLEILRNLPKTIKTRTPATQRTLVRTGLATLQVISLSFIAKSQGHTDAAGLRWVPLAPTTVDIRRRKGPPKPGPSPRRSLYDIMRESGLLIVSLSPGATPSSAPIMSPRVPKQVFHVGKGYVKVGTARKYARLSHEGRPPLPQRRLWAAPARWPSSFWSVILKEAAAGIAGVIAEQLT